LDFLPQMVRLQDEPIADPVCMPVYFLSRLARQHGVVVAQAGEGSDELFWGYERWKQMRQIIRWNGLPVPNMARRVGLTALQVAGKSQGVAYELLSRANRGQPIFWGGAYAFTESMKRNLLSNRLQNHFRSETSWSAVEPLYRRFLERSWEAKPVKWMTYLDLNMRLPELLLMRLDKMGMGAGLEARVPFLDHKITELAMSIPEQVITRGSETKHILKKAVRGVIPSDVIDRHKQGFGVPVYEWFTSELGEYARRELLEFCRQTDFLHWPAVSRLLLSGRGRGGWFLLNFALWWKEFIAGESTAVESAVAPLAMTR
jgi:asparagine synthase (glutamine-hydrolysing)